MTTRFWPAIVLLASTSLVHASNKPLPAPLAPALPVEVYIEQSELGYTVPGAERTNEPYIGAVPDLIVSAINSHRRQRGEAEIAPMKNQLVEYNFEDKLVQALRAKLASNDVSPHPTIAVFNAWRDRVDPKDAAQVSPLVLVIRTSYMMDYFYYRIRVSFSVMLAEREVSSSGTIDWKQPTYRHELWMDFPLVKVKGSDKLARWNAMGRDRLVRMLDDAIAHGTDMLVYDFSPEARKLWEQPMDTQTFELKGFKVTGALYRQSPDFVCIRNHGGSQCIEPVSETDPLPPGSATPSATPAIPDAGAASASTTTDAQSH